jgi:hypothetical protein
LVVIASFPIAYICLLPRRSFLLSFLHVKWVCGCEFFFCFLLSLPHRKSLGSCLLSFFLNISLRTSATFCPSCHPSARAWDTWWELSSVVFFYLVVLVLLETLQELGISGTSFYLSIICGCAVCIFPMLSAASNLTGSARVEWQHRETHLSFFCSLCWQWTYRLENHPAIGLFLLCMWLRCLSRISTCLALTTSLV